jgi:hypothetical protein
MVHWVIRFIGVIRAIRVIRVIRFMRATRDIRVIWFRRVHVLAMKKPSVVFIWVLCSVRLPCQFPRLRAFHFPSLRDC